MSMRKINDEVFYFEDPIVLMGRREIQFLKEKVGSNERRRIRLCAHGSTEDPVHEMFVTLTKESYIRPHKHLAKSESFHVIEGSMDLVVFDEEGEVTGAIPLGAYPTGGEFYHRFAGPSFHTLLIRSNILVFHETTSGPFKKSDTLFAPWSPEEHDQRAAQQFMDVLERRVERLVSLGRKG